MKSNTTAKIYQIRNMVTGYSYIGVTTDIPSRMKAHKNSLKREAWTILLMQEHYLLHGANSFELVILDECDVSIMFEVESAYIAHFTATSSVYNTLKANEIYNAHLDDKLHNINDTKVLPFVC